MPDKVFFDSNIILYLLSSDASKAWIAKELMRKKGTISVQVLNEVTQVTQRKLRYTWAQTHSLISALQGFCKVVPLTLASHESGRTLAERYGFSVYDAMIVASALLSGARILYSEDMHHGLVVDTQLSIINPFAGLKFGGNQP